MRDFGTARCCSTSCAEARQVGPLHIALIDRNRRWTYAELQRSATRLAARLLALGLAPRDRVVLQMPNAAEFVLVYFALARIGAIPVMALRSHRQAELRHFLNASGATAYIIGDRAGNFDFRTMADALRSEAPALRHVIVAGEPLPGQHALADLLRDGDVDEPPVTVDPAEVGTMLLSGGTTSMSKLIPRTHQDYVLNARLCGTAAGFDERTVFMAILPLGHNYNLASPGILGALTSAARWCCRRPAPTSGVRDGAARARNSDRRRGAADRWLAEARRPAAIRSRVARVVQNGGARLAPELRQRLRERFGVTPQEIYGTAEGLINMTRLDDATSGCFTARARRCVTPTRSSWSTTRGAKSPDGKAGELLTRGPYTIRGYYDAAEKNAEAFTPDGYYRMGDIVRARPLPIRRRAAQGLRQPRR